MFKLTVNCGVANRICLQPAGLWAIPGYENNSGFQVCCQELQRRIALTSWGSGSNSGTEDRWKIPTRYYIPHRTRQQRKERHYRPPQKTQACTLGEGNGGELGLLSHTAIQPPCLNSRKQTHRHPVSIADKNALQNNSCCIFSAC